MEVSVKVVVFEHPDPATWDIYCSYCPALRYCFGRGDTIQEVIAEVKDYFLRELRGRFKFRNLAIRKWVVTENSVVPPIFTDEELHRLTERNYEISIPHPIIVEITVELPEATDE